MVTVDEKKFAVSDWINGVRIIKAQTLASAASIYKNGETLVPTLEKNQCSVFAIEATKIPKAVTSKSDPIEKLNALADLDGVKFFI